ncbi:RsfA family transcriptional regulator [Halobacillus amylolyticus]|uniref:RsfA family transcriptional regulator n=1 Tax=Halobacillus amylolyticus TaxID=2932259 RepID=A0ABY4HE64_9BACI|nr:RsfA family transcriptional regulator [Halobacillus amylolyticus]UOR12934.1 RsfA family transcriptional regulator [Halobacillus amylolyticus]
MDAPRQDAWKDEEDVLLARTVLRHIQDGKTQLEAFQEVAEQLKRTPAACGFRWNATVRKSYQKDIREAKQNRKSRSVLAQASLQKDTPISLDDAISFLKEMKTNQYSTQDHEQLQSQLHKLNEDNVKLKDQLKQLEEAWNEMDKLVTFVKRNRHQTYT